MQPRRRHGDDRVPLPNALGTKDGVRFHHADRRRREVVLVGPHQVAVLGRLAAHQGRTGLCAAGGDPGDDRRDPLGHDLPAGHVILEEEWFGAAGHQVVDDHGDQVDAHGVVPVQGAGQRDLRTDAIGGGGQEGAPVRRGVQSEQPGETAQAADDLRAVGLLHGRTHERDRALARVDVDAGPGIGELGTRGLGAGGHGRVSASSAPPGTVALPAC